MATVEAICISKKKGIVKKSVYIASFESDWGISGDAHAGKWHRQVSLLAGESIDRVKEKLPSLSDGAFAENIITRGMDHTALQIGDRLQVGDSLVLEITQIGKKCHNDGCAIKKATGDCIMPKEGLFAKVIHGGNVKKGDRIQQCTVNASRNSGNPALEQEPSTQILPEPVWENMDGSVANRRNL